MFLQSLLVLLVGGCISFTNGLYIDSQQLLLLSRPPGDHNVVRRPNIVFILTDDQDLHMDSLDYMPHLKKYLIDEGALYRRHFVTTALCCPSRVSLWTGRVPHNTNVTDVNPPHGGYPKFVTQGFNEAYLPVWLQNAGYNTFYTGKLFNAHTVDNYNDPYPAGFNGSDFLLDPFTYQYLNATYQRNRESPQSYLGHHTTDVIAQKAYGFLEEAVQSYQHNKTPFFLTIAPIAPHSNVESNTIDLVNPVDTFKMTAPIPARRHEHLFHDVQVPRTPNFNPNTPSSVSWISRLPLQNASNIAYNDHFYRSRLRALQGVDEIVEGVMQRLEESGILEDTYIIYTSDNGYHIGQHRLQPGKECGFEEDIAVPLVIRGPGVPKGEVITETVTTHVDLAPTIFRLAGIDLRNDFDGTSIPLTPVEILEARGYGRREHVGVEYWGVAIEEGWYGYREEGDILLGLHLNNTYKALRILGEGYNLYYSVWCSGEHELYDLDLDPYQIDNIYPGSVSALGPVVVPKVLGLPLQDVLPRLDALLLVLKSCKGETCSQPWDVLHPDGDVKDLGDALHRKFDTFYEDQPKVKFDRCEAGYILDAEGPQDALTWRNGLKWSEWT